MIGLASHVRRVRVPSQSSDVDQYLDDLFMPVLDGNLDEYSDARSLVASIKGGRSTAAARAAAASGVDQFVQRLVGDGELSPSDGEGNDAQQLARLIRGGGKGLSGLDPQVGRMTNDSTNYLV